MRHQLSEPDAIRRALRAAPPPRLLLAARGSDPVVEAVCREAAAAGVAVERVSSNDLRRMAAVRPPPTLLALCGPDPNLGFDALLARPGALWLLAGVTYAGNAGYAIRSAEVSGAAGIVLDEGFAPSERKRALRFSMHAERFFPVHWCAAPEVVAAARRAGRPVVAIEDVGDRAPWEVDLRGSPLLVIGGERDGIDPALLRQADAVVRIPMRGFVPAYNLQAAMAVVMGERLRQEG